MNNEKELDIFNSSLSKLEDIEVELNKQLFEINKLYDINIDKCQSNLDLWDYLFAVTFGIISATISSNKDIDNIFDSIHSDASKSNPQTLLGKLLNHNQQNIDKIDGKFVNRNGESADIGFHRLLWGHDLLSLGPDNPFNLMIRQSGIISGITKVFTHLIADTFSKQGLPILGHSYLDYIDSTTNKTSNYLKDIAMLSANNQRSVAIINFKHLFSVHMQDILSQGFVYGTAKAYFYARDINDIIRQKQYKIISYGVNFFANAIIGAKRQAGIPYINWPTLVLLIKEVVKLYTDSYKIIKQLEERTDKLIKENEELERKVFNTGKDLISYKDPYDYNIEILKSEETFNSITDFFEEG